MVVDRSSSDRIVVRKPAKIADELIAMTRKRLLDKNQITPIQNFELKFYEKQISA